MSIINSTPIFEDQNEQHHLGFGDYTALMTEEQKRRGKYYSDMYSQRRAELDGKAETLSWDEIEKLHNCDRDADPEDDSAPNNFLPLLTPTVEGQVAHMSSAETEYTFVSDNPAHEQFMKKLKAGFAYNKRMSRFDAHVKDMDRSYILLGGSWITCSWAKGYGRSSPDKPEGYAKISTIPIRSVLVDGRIKDFKDLQEAEYIIHEIGFVPISWIRKEYGDDMADGVQAGYNRYESNANSTTLDDYNSAMLLHVWTRSNEQGNLQLIEMDSQGLILRESDASKPYYEFVDNEYPFAFARGMYIAGSFYGFGDGKILLRFQKLVNNLADEVEIAARFSAQTKTLVDRKSGIALEEVDSDPSHWILCDNPNNNVRQMPAPGLNQIVIEAIKMYVQQAQSATRFADIMTGAKQQASTTATATQNQVLQGAIGINDKKADVAELRRWAAKYSMKLCLEKWDSAFWVRVDKDYDMIDMQIMANAPASIPATYDTIDSFRKNNPDKRIKDLPTFESVNDDAGNVVMGSLDFDVEVVMGNAMQKDSTSRYNIASLAATQVMGDEDGVPRNVMGLEQYRKILGEILGMEIDDDKENAPALTDPTKTNPVSDDGGLMPNNGSQVPPPNNLASTVPGVSGQDKRGLMLNT